MSEGRLQHLLQPIRDLSKNWNIDLASELEEYMDKLDSLSISFDPEDAEAGASFSKDSENGVMNFAEAALLIQGTSVIYSRKVEYLHALVYQTLAHLSKQQDDKQQSAQTADQEDQEDGNEDSGATLLANPLPLYDELDEAKPSHITLKNTIKETGQRRRKTAGKDAALNRSKNNIQASIALMGSLVPDERDHGETFKLLSCNLHASGVLLLDEASKKYLGAHQRAVGDQPLAFGETPRRRSGMWTASDGSDPAAALNFDQMDVDDDDDAGDNGFEDQPDYEFDNTEPMQDETADATEDVPQQEEQAPEQPSRTTTRVARALPAGEKDPWAPLDAYDASTSVARPFRKGKSYPRVPAYKKKKSGPAALSNKESAVGIQDDDAEQDGLSDPSFQERFFTGSGGPQWASWVWTETANENPLEKTCKRTFCRAPLLVKSCDALWQREAKWRSAMRRCEAREKQSAQAMLLREQAMEEEEADGHDEMQALTLSTATARLDMAFQTNANGNAEEEDDDDGGDNDFDGGFDGGDWDQEGDMDDPVSSYEAAASVASTHDGPLTYEEICRQHLASFMSGTEKYVRETDLSKQVSDWQERLTPLLKQQDAHPPFDIHHYGREIIGRLEEETDRISKTPKKDKKSNKRARPDPPEDDEEAETVPFETLVDGKSQFEVCRLFLASLQLANNGNVALSHAHKAADHGRIPFEMQLLTTANAYEALQA
ncbi:Condensin-2 complex subunit H2 [Phytophthora boehmeriae]|uniref:Condensin-2 complex subunit H2 n=1 Tax=Phytophthora boehmeriae TaxID=109152 RepID=A0A8T1WM59_9STRA|nr:Condensin-2 complex subunit H2 [Phytophthora boehmeriae]